VFSCVEAIARSSFTHRSFLLLPSIGSLLPAVPHSTFPASRRPLFFSDHKPRYMVRHPPSTLPFSGFHLLFSPFFAVFPTGLTVKAGLPVGYSLRPGRFFFPLLSDGREERRDPGFCLFPILDFPTLRRTGCPERCGPWIFASPFFSLPSLLISSTVRRSSLIFLTRSAILILNFKAKVIPDQA